MTASVIRGAIGATIKGPYIAPWKNKGFSTLIKLINVLPTAKIVFR